MKEWEVLLRDKGFSLEDVRRAFKEKISYLRGKKHVVQKHALGGSKSQEARRFVTLVQQSYPIKMFVLQEVGTELRFGYYIMSLKKLRDEGKLSILWGQFNPMISKEDLNTLLIKAREAGIL